MEITDKRRPFRALLRGDVKGISAEEVLTRPLNLREVAAGVNHELGECGLAELEADLRAECASVRLRPGIAEIWRSYASEARGSGLFQPGAALWGASFIGPARYSGRRDPLLRGWTGSRRW